MPRFILAERLYDRPYLLARDREDEGREELGRLALLTRDETRRRQREFWLIREVLPAGDAHDHPVGAGSTDLLG